MKNVVMFCAHCINECVLSALHDLRDAESAYTDIALIYDNTKRDYSKSIGKQIRKVFLFDHERIANRYFMLSCSKEGRIYDGNTTFPILEFYREHPEYAYYWRIEYDVRLDGNWRSFFERFLTDDSDLLTTTLFDFDFRPDWMWWNTLVTPWYCLNVKKIRGFLPVARFSNKSMNLLARKYRHAWKGHDEVVVPTLLNHYGQKITDIGGHGQYTPPAYKDLWYVNTPSRVNLAPGSMVCPPEKPDPQLSKYRLRHPIK